MMGIQIADNLAYKVTYGDTLEVIGRRHGFGNNWKKIWNFPENRKLVSKRGAPASIRPGDIIVIPPNAKQIEEERTSIGNFVFELSEEKHSSQECLRLLNKAIRLHVQQSSEAIDAIETQIGKMRSWSLGADTTAVVGTACAAMSSVFQKISNAAMPALVKLFQKRGLKGVQKYKKHILKLVIKFMKSTPVGLKALQAQQYGGMLGGLQGSDRQLLDEIGTFAKIVSNCTKPSYIAGVIAQRWEGKPFSEAAKTDVTANLEDFLVSYRKQSNQLLQKLKARRQKEIKYLEDVETAIFCCYKLLSRRN